ncbi:hypothetical protein LZC95_23245 [Pendulispora brunnea]|uniref:NIPSNAP domain-containing protein n=1 Tax=Pendulispora brunnea TaxID=2905690 RepID=A0ABZ2KM34_9BACT
MLRMGISLGALLSLASACGSASHSTAQVETLSFASQKRSSVSSVAQFVVWKPKEGQQQNFDDGYKQHLRWHASNGDTWGWYGWYFTTGPRDGQFMDATIGRAWSDFDKPLKPAEDAADNRAHVYPFGELQSVCRVIALEDLSIGRPSGLTSKYARLLTLTVTDTPNAVRVLAELKANYQEAIGIKTMLAYRIVDGGNLNDILLFMGFPTVEEYGKSDHLAEDIETIEHQLGLQAIGAMRSESLTYRADMSLLPN